MPRDIYQTVTDRIVAELGAAFLAADLDLVPVGDGRIVLRDIAADDA